MPDQQSEPNVWRQFSLRRFALKLNNLRKVFSKYVSVNAPDKRLFKRDSPIEFPSRANVRKIAQQMLHPNRIQEQILATFRPYGAFHIGVRNGENAAKQNACSYMH